MKNSINKLKVSQHKISTEIIHKLYELDLLLEEQSWSLEDWMSFEGEHALYTISLDEEFKSFALVLISDVIHLLKIVSDPSVRRQGHGACLISQIRADFPSKNIFLEVGANNQVALKFYLKHGFEKLNIVDKFYKNGEAAQRMLQSATQGLEN